MKSLEQYKQTKERGCSVDEVINSFSDKKQDYTDAIVIGLNKEGVIDFSYSTSNNATLIGLLEVIKTALVEEIREAE